jgi:hypothetical protein
MTRRAILCIGVLTVVMNAPPFALPPQAADGESALQQADKPRGRLPNLFGKLGVSADQREKIYAVQAEFDPQIDELLDRVEELRAQRNSEVEAVLTDAQREQLARLREEQAARRRAKAESTKQP